MRKTYCSCGKKNQQVVETILKKRGTEKTVPPTIILLCNDG
jgi:hypothetical protein